jgi:hypothetical protein
MKLGWQPALLAAALLCGTAYQSEATTLTAAESYGTYNYSRSDAFGSGSFGTVTVSDLGSGTAKFQIDVAPNSLLDTGAHYILTLSLVSGGTVDTSSISNSVFTVAAGTFSNPPFGNFNVAFSSPCNQGNPTCQATNGQGFSFNVLNVAGLMSATDQYGSEDIFFASDISHFDGDTTSTGAVGALRVPPNPPVTPVPLPSALFLMGSVVAGAVGFGARRKRGKAKV